MFGWFFDDYKIIINITEVEQMGSDGSHNSYISEAKLYYYPAEYGDITEECGENMVSEFIQKRKQAVGDLTWYQPVKTEFEAVEQPATEATTEAEEPAEEVTATDSGIIGGPVGNSEDSSLEE